MRLECRMKLWFWTLILSSDLIEVAEGALPAVDLVLLAATLPGHGEPALAGLVVAPFRFGAAGFIIFALRICFCFSCFELLPWPVSGSGLPMGSGLILVVQCNPRDGRPSKSRDILCFLLKRIRFKKNFNHFIRWYDQIWDKSKLTSNPTRKFIIWSKL